MPKAPAKRGFYAVRKGNAPGIYATWDECEAQVKGFTGSVYKKFTTLAEAEAYVGDSAPGSSSSRAAGQTSSSRPPKMSYTIPPEVSTSPASDVYAPDGRLIVYTDGACQGNGRQGSQAGIGVWWGVNHPRNLAEKCPGDQTNNRAELIAIVRAVETAPEGEALLIKSDSKYSIQCVQDWLPNWQRNNWRTASGEGVKNKEVIQYLAHLLRCRGYDTLQYVKGHAGEVGNEGADRLAVSGASHDPLPERDWLTEITRIKPKPVPIRTKTKVNAPAVLGAPQSPDPPPRPRAIASEPVLAQKKTYGAVPAVTGAPRPRESASAIPKPPPIQTKPKAPPPLPIPSSEFASIYPSLPSPLPAGDPLFFSSSPTSRPSVTVSHKVAEPMASGDEYFDQLDDFSYEELQHLP